MCDENNESMWCNLHENYVDWSTFEWKGCWGCQHFSGLSSNYVYVSEAADMLKVSERTVRQWIKKGVLEGALYIRVRSWFSLSSPPAKYVINRKSVEQARDKCRKSNTT